MSEQSPSSHFPHTLDKGFTVIRRAIGTDMEDLIESLDAGYADEPGVEIRYLDARKAPAVQLVQRYDAATMRPRNPDASLSEVYGEIRTRVPEVESVRNVQFDDIQVFPNRKGEIFFELGLDPDSRQEILEERSRILRVVADVGDADLSKMPEAKGPFMTVAFLGASALREVETDITRDIDEFLPLEATLEPVVFFPQED